MDLFPIQLLFFKTILCAIIIFAATCRTVLHPTSAYFISLFNIIQTNFRIAYDNIIYHMILKRRGRIPLSDTFAARRIKGPGLSTFYLHEVKLDTAIIALQLYLEKLEITYYSTYMRNLIFSPSSTFVSLHDSILKPFAALVDYQHTTYQLLIKRSNELNIVLDDIVLKRQNILTNKYRIPYDIQIRQYQKDHEETIRAAKAIIKHFITNKVFCYIKDPTEIKKFWESQNLDENDWESLTLNYLCDIFGSNFRYTIEETDSSFALKVSHIKLNNYVDIALHGVPRDDLDKVTPSFNYNIISQPPPTINIPNVNMIFSPNYDTQTYSSPWDILEKKYNLNQYEEDRDYDMEELTIY